MGYQSMMGYTSIVPFGGLLTGLLVFLIKFLVIVFVLALIIGAFTWVKNKYFVNTNILEQINQNPMMKAIIGIPAAIILLYFILFIINYMGSNYSMGAMGGYSNMYGFSLTGFLVIIFKLLTYLFIFTFVISLVAYLMKQIGISELNLFKTAFQTPNKNTINNAPKPDTFTGSSDAPTPAQEQDPDIIDI